MAIDLSTWLNQTTNLPDVWDTIMSEVLTDRYGEFAYHYESSRTKKNDDGEIIYSKPYTIDLTINIDTVYDDEAEKVYEVSQKQKERFTYLYQICEIINKSYDNDKAIEHNLEELILNLKEYQNTLTEDGD